MNESYGPITMQDDRSQKILGIDALRGFLCLYIIAYHLVSHYSDVGPIFKILFSNGLFAVQIFFCISGFLIFHSFSRRSQSDSRPIISFYARRAQRILPLWWLFLILLYFCGKITDLKILFLNLTFLFGFFSYNAVFIPVAVSWSLFVEEIFYLFFPWIFKRLNLQGTLLFLFLSVGASLLLKYFSYFIHFPTGNEFIEHFPLTQFQYFFLGILLYHLQNHQFSSKLLNIVSLIILCVSFFYNFLPNFVSIFLITLICIRPKTILFRVLDLRVLKWIGVRCYCVYLIHSELGMAFDIPTTKFLSMITNVPDMKLILHFLILSLETLLIAGISYKYIERPFMKVHP